MAHEQFIGVWKLVSAEYRRANGAVIEYLGENPTGMLAYDASGYMSVRLMRRDRPVFASNDRLGGTLEEIKTAFDGYHAYYGTYTINEAERIVTHHLEGCSFPNWVGADQMRFFELSGNQLTLRTPPLSIGGEQVKGYLIWQRAK